MSEEKELDEKGKQQKRPESREIINQKFIEIRNMCNYVEWKGMIAPEDKTQELMCKLTFGIADMIENLSKQVEELQVTLEKQQTILGNQQTLIRSI